MGQSAFLLVGVLTVIAVREATAAEPQIRVVVWDEQQPKQKEAYENFLGNAIADHLRQQPGLRVISANIDQPEKGLPDSLLDSTDVLVWWGHVRHAEITPAMATAIIDRIKRGQLCLIALHSAHWSAPFVEAMNERTRMDARKRYPDPPNGPPVKFEFVPPDGRFVPAADSLVTPAYYAKKRGPLVTDVRVDMPNCVFPSFKAHGKPSQVTVLKPDHPIAAGVPKSFTIPQTEMYSEPFHVPQPDEVILEERWEEGEHFRSGCVWQLGAGRVFYFRPGHETFPIYKQEFPLKIVANAVKWLGAELNKSRNAK
jgi:trehalose utilization protein